MRDKTSYASCLPFLRLLSCKEKVFDNLRNNKGTYWTLQHSASAACIPCYFQPENNTEDPAMKYENFCGRRPDSDRLEEVLDFYFRVVLFAFVSSLESDWVGRL